MEFSWLRALLYVTLFVVNTAFIYQLLHSVSMIFSPVSAKVKSAHAGWAAALGSLDLLIFLWVLDLMRGQA